MLFDVWKMRGPRLAIVVAVLTVLAMSARAEGPAFVQRGGVFGRVVVVKSNNLVEWYNTTQHRLKITYKLTLEEDRVREGEATIDSKQKLEDPKTKSAAEIVKIQILKIAIVD